MAIIEHMGTKCGIFYYFGLIMCCTVKMMKIIFEFCNLLTENEAVLFRYKLIFYNISSGFWHCIAGLTCKSTGMKELTLGAPWHRKATSDSTTRSWFQEWAGDWGKCISVPSVISKHFTSHCLSTYFIQSVTIHSL